MKETYIVAPFPDNGVESRNRQSHNFHGLLLCHLHTAHQSLSGRNRYLKNWEDLGQIIIHSAYQGRRWERRKRQCLG